MGFSFLVYSLLIFLSFFVGDAAAMDSPYFSRHFEFLKILSFLFVPLASFVLDHLLLPGVCKVF